MEHSGFPVARAAVATPGETVPRTCTPQRLAGGPRKATGKTAEQRLAEERQE